MRFWKYLFIPPIWLPFLIFSGYQAVHEQFDYTSIDNAVYQYPEAIVLVQEMGDQGWELVEVEGEVFIFIRSSSYGPEWEYIASDDSLYPDTLTFLSSYGAQGWELTATYEDDYIFKRLQAP
jgi:hypothetical protein